MKKTIYLNATVVTMDETSPRAEAFGVMGDCFSCVGDSGSVKNWGGSEAEVVNLSGRIVLPGLIETHNHLSYFSLRMDHVDCSTPQNKDIPQVLGQLRKRAEQTDKDGIVIGWGFDDTLVSDLRHLHRDELDSISTDHFILVTHTSGHLGYVNSRVLDTLKIDASTPDPEGGEIHRDDSGRATGLLKETALFALMDLVPKLTAAQIKPLLERAAAIANQSGVTSIHDAAIGMEGNGSEIVRAYRELARDGQLNVRAYLTLIYTLYEQFDQLGMGTGFGSDRAQLGSIKLFQDGSIQGYTGWLSTAYHSRQDDGHVGKPIMDQKTLDDHVEKYHASGLQIAIHGNGDAAIESIITAVERAQEKCSRKDPRHLLIHCQTVRDDQLARMKSCGLMPSFFVEHVYYWGDRHRDVFLGPERAARIDPLASCLKAGLPFTLHSDLPVTPMAPFHSIHTAVNRMTRNGELLGPDERISVHDALKAYTTWAAMAGFEEDKKGSIAPGKLADWIVVSDNPLTVDSEKLKEIKVLETVVGGRKVYSDND